MNLPEQHRRTDVTQFLVLWLPCGHCTCRGGKSENREEAGSCDRAPGERWGRQGNSDSSGLIYCQEGAHHKSHYFQPHLLLDDTWIINNSKTNNIFLCSWLLFIQSPHLFLLILQEKLPISPFGMNCFFSGGPPLSIFLLVRLFHFALYSCTRLCLNPSLHCACLKDRDSNTCP